MTTSVQNAVSQPQKIGGRLSLRVDQIEMRKSTGAALAAWLRTTYRPVIEEDPTPAFVFMACFFAVMRRQRLDDGPSNTAWK
jgi:hypothetical protein